MQLCLFLSIPCVFFFFSISCNAIFCHHFKAATKMNFRVNTVVDFLGSAPDGGNGRFDFRFFFLPSCFHDFKHLLKKCTVIMIVSVSVTMLTKV